MSESALLTVYASLLEQPVSPPDGGHVVPGSAKESPLIQLLLGREGDSPPVVRVRHDMLGRRELTLFIEWVDLGAEWESRPGNNGSSP